MNSGHGGLISLGKSCCFLVDLKNIGINTDKCIYHL